jgi:hypothetical protein
MLQNCFGLICKRYHKHVNIQNVTKEKQLIPELELDKCTVNSTNPDADYPDRQLSRSAYPFR